MQTNEGFHAGLMMETPLTVAAILRRAAQFFPEPGPSNRFRMAALLVRDVR